MNKTFILDKLRFPEFFALLQTWGKVWAPVRVSEQSFALREVDNSGQIAFDALRTILPPKKLFFKQRQALLAYKGQQIEEVAPDSIRQVLFGIHPCDLHGLGIMDTIYGAEPADVHYLTPRSTTMIIGTGCMPDKHCFCKSVGTDAPDKGYDMFLTDIKDQYFIQISCPEALALVERQPQLFRQTDDQDKDQYKEFWLKRDQAFTIGFEASNLPALMDMEWDNPVWEELGKRCLSCGNCTPVCPTCYCFDLVDVASLDGESGTREREWDSCQFTGFAQVAGGFNFRPGPVDRLKFWYRHKLHGFDDPYGMPTCVGCGRCTESCPSGIDDIVGVVLRLQSSQNGKSAVDDKSHDQAEGGGS